MQLPNLESFSAINHQDGRKKAAQMVSQAEESDEAGGKRKGPGVRPQSMPAHHPRGPQTGIKWATNVKAFSKQLYPVYM